MNIRLLLTRVAMPGLIAVLLAPPRSAGARGRSRSVGQCATSPLVRAEPPPAPGADRFGDGPWYVNTDRTIWAGWDAGCWHVGRNKVLWIRPGRTLTIRGTRLDADAPALEADIPCCYGPRFQATALHFPTAGCWRVTAKAVDHELTFVTAVGEDQPPQLRRLGCGGMKQ